MHHSLHVLDRMDASANLNTPTVANKYNYIV